MSNSRRYEILLPVRFNDGEPVPPDLIAATLLELERRFGAVSCETQIIQGIWQQEGSRFRDELTRVFIDAADTRATRAFFLRFKQTLKTRLRQHEIYVTSYPIDVL